MQLTVENLKQAGAFAGQPVAKTIEWIQVDEDGTETEFSAETFIRKASCATFEQEGRAVSSGLDIVATRISSSVVDAEGSPVFTYEQAELLNDALASALFAAILEVNPRAKKKSPPSVKSGASLSSTESAEEQ